MQDADKNKSIDKHLRSQLLRKLIIILFVAIVFVGFMSFALYQEYGPDSETVDIFSDITPASNDGNSKNKTNDKK